VAETQEDRSILAEVDQYGVGTITLNRPHRLNAFTAKMLQNWAAALRDMGTDPAVKVIVIVGAGRAFCTGADTAQVAQRGEATLMEAKTFMMNSVHSIARALRDIDKPVIAALNGLARAGGVDMALLCDIRLAAESANFSESYVNLGMISGGGGAYLLPPLVGTAKTFELLWGGEVISAAEAERIGLVSRVYPDAEFAAEIAAYARRLAAQPPAAVQFYKRAVRQAPGQTLEAHLDAVSSHLAILRSTPEHKERIQALAARKPK